MKLGLRAQIVLALLVVFALSFALLGTAAVRLTTAAREGDRARNAQHWAEAVAAIAQASNDEQALAAAFDDIIATRHVAGVRLSGRDAPAVQRGSTTASAVNTTLADGRTLTLWLLPQTEQLDGPLRNLLSFYVIVTGLAVMLLAYLGLTYLIVRPLDALTRSSEQLAAGSAQVRVAEKGAAEVVRLAAAFNDMARQLRDERSALEARLRELEQTTEELRTAQRQIIHGEKLASVGRLAAGVAHEIGNPLAAILGLLELLRGGALPEAKQTEFLARIQRETERIHLIIRNLLDFARREVDTDNGVQSSDLQDVVQDAIALVQPQKDSRDVAIDLRVAPGMGRVVGPAPRLTQVTLNLLFNAVDALEGKGHIRVAIAPAEPGEVLLTVEDDGPGIAPDMLDHLFEPFTTTKPVGKGTGLGLAVCHTIIEGVGGSITAHNGAHGGACFEVRLRRTGSLPPSASPAPG